MTVEGGIVYSLRPSNGKKVARPAPRFLSLLIASRASVFVLVTRSCTPLPNAVAIAASNLAGKEINSPMAPITPG